MREVRHGSPVAVEQLLAREIERLRAIRLRALREAPDAFGTTLEEAEARPPEDWEGQLEASHVCRYPWRL